MGGARITLRGLHIDCGRAQDVADQLEPLHQALGPVSQAADRRRLRRLLPRRLGRAHGEHPGVGSLRPRRLNALRCEVLEADAVDRPERGRSGRRRATRSTPARTLTSAAWPATASSFPRVTPRARSGVCSTRSPLQEPAPSEVIVVDDGSTDDDRGASRRQAGARVLSTGGGRFAGGARNARLGRGARRRGRLPRLRRRARARLGRGRGPGDGGVPGRARRLRANVRGRHALGMGLSPAGRDAVPATRRAARDDLPVGVLHARAAGRTAALGRELRRRGRPLLRRRARSRASARLRPALLGSARARTAYVRRPAPSAAAARIRDRACSVARARSSSVVPCARVPLQYFALLRLPVVYRRIADDPRLRSRFLSLLPRLAVAEWTLGASAVRYAGATAGAARRSCSRSSSERQADPRHRGAPLGHDLGREDARARARRRRTSTSRSARGRRTGSARRGFERYFTVVTSRERDPYRAGLERTLSLRYDLAAQLRLGAALARRRPDPARLPPASHAAGSLGRRPLVKDPIALLSAEWLAETFGMDVVVLIRHPAAFAASLQAARLEAQLRDVHPGRARARGGCGPTRPRSASRPSVRARSWRRRRCSGGLLYNAVDGYRERHPDWAFVRHEDASARPGRDLRAALRAARARAARPRRARRSPARARPTTRPSWRRRTRSSSTARRASGAGARDLTAEEVETLRERTRDVWPRFYSDEDW